MERTGLWMAKEMRNVIEIYCGKIQDQKCASVNTLANGKSVSSAKESNGPPSNMKA